MISAAVPAGSVAFRPRPGRTVPTPATRRSKNRRRHRHTRSGDTPSWRATAIVATPSAASNNPRASITSRAGNVCDRAIRCNASRS